MGKITTHYSGAELEGLIEAANSVCETKSRTGDVETKSGYSSRCNRIFYILNLVRPERFERPTPWFVAKYSIQLSYGRIRAL